MSEPYLSIIIPAFNEQDRIWRTLETIRSFLIDRQYTHEIIVVDNASTDSTTPVVERFMDSMPNLRLLREPRQGKGYAVTAGVLESSGRYVFFSDADLSTPIEELEKLLRHLENGAHVAIASRALEASEIAVRQPWYREFAGKIFNLGVQLLVLKGIRDTQCGFKGFKRDVIDFIFGQQTIFGYGFDVEILLIAKRHGYTIVELPVRWANDPSSHVKPIRDACRMFMDLVRIRVNDARGAYDRDRLQRSSGQSDSPFVPQRDGERQDGGVADRAR